MAKQLFSTFARRLTVAFLLTLLVAMATRSHAQNAGVVGIATKEIQVFSAQSTALSSGGSWQCLNSPTPIPCPYLPDLGAGCSFLSYQTFGFTGTIDLDWKPIGSSTAIALVQASYGSAGSDSSNHILQLGGYFPNLRATVTPSTGSVSAWYTASAAPCPLFGAGVGTNGPSSPITCDQTATFLGITNGLTVGSVGVGPLLPGDTVVICGFEWSFSGATSAGSVQSGWASSSTCTSLSINWVAYTTSATPQLFTIPLQQRSNVRLNQFPCFVNNSGSTASVSISWASVHGL